MRSRLFIFLFIISLTVGKVFAEETQSSKSSIVMLNGKPVDASPVFADKEGTKKIFLRNALQEEADSLAEAGRYDEAIAKFQEAIRPELINMEAEKGYALFGILQIHQWQGKFELALEELQWFLKARPDKDYYIDKKLELEALIKARDTGSYQPVYEFIEAMKRKWEKLLPPNGSNTYTESVTSPIIQLYDYMGDWDGGVVFVDPIINYDRKKNHRDSVVEYEKIRNAFLEDKKHGTKGRATQALIQSDYFPW